MIRPTSCLLLPLAALISQATAAPILNHGDTWHYKKGTAAAQADWRTATDAVLGGTWLTGPGGIGYSDGDDATILSDMLNGYTTVYMRQTFTAGTVGATERLVLSVDYDDAYIAWLDGVEIDRTSNAPAGALPGNTASASSTHEAGTARVTDVGLASTLIPPGDHVLAVMLFNESLGSSDASLIADLSTEPAPPAGTVSGTISADTTWTKENSPYIVTGNVTVAGGATLTIEPGVEVRFGQGFSLQVNGLLLAEGTEAERITFTRNTGATSWSRIGLAGAGEHQMAWCDIKYATGSGNVQARSTKLNLEHVRFTNTTVQLVDMISSSCVIEYCEFPSIQNNELLHFSNMPSTGHAFISYNIFGTPGIPATSGYNDIVDFTGGNRPGPIVRFLGNIFLSGVDDCFDMDGTDAHIEGNAFLDVRRDAARESSSNPITTGANGSDLSELVICRNVFYNCEHLVMEKDYGTVLLQNNTIVKVTPNPLSNNNGEASGIIMFGEPWRSGYPFGKGALYEGNIAADLQISSPWVLLSNATASTGCFLVQSHNCYQGFTEPGVGNLNADPLLVSTAGVAWDNIFQKFALQPGSPCIGAGPNGLDMGALVPAGASVSGAPAGTVSSRTATLKVAGPGIWAYKWRINGGAWSDEVSLVPAAIWNGASLTADMFAAAPPIALTDLADGPQSVEVLGKNSAGDWQETPAASAAWTVLADTDHDGIPDAWEGANGLNAADSGDAATDLDGDGASNLDEYIAGTNPQDRTSALTVSAAITTGTPSITFPGVAGHSYRIEGSDDLAAGSWSTVATIPAVAADGPVTTPDTSASGSPRRFYRVVTPAE